MESISSKKHFQIKIMGYDNNILEVTFINQNEMDIQKII